MNPKDHRSTEPAERRPLKISGPAAIVLVALLAGAPSLLYPFARDQAIFAYIGDVWLRGGLPYRDAWDVKPPLIFLLYSIAQTLFGRSPLACHVLDLLNTIAVGLLLLKLGRRLSLPSAGLWAGAAYPVLYYACWLFPDVAQSESFAAPWAVLLFLAAYDARESGRWPSSLTAGVCVGLMALLKTTLVILALPALLVLVWRRNARWGLVPVAGVGLALPFALTIGYFALQGEVGLLRELVTAQVAYAAPRSDIADPFHAFLLYLFNWPLLSWAFLVGLVALADRRSRFAWTVGFAWLAMALVNVVVQHRLISYHSIPAAAPLALMGGAGLAVVSQAIRRIRNGVFRAVSTALMMAVPMLLLLPSMDRYQFAIERWTGRMSEHRYLERSTGPQEFVASEVVDTGRLLGRATRPGDPILVIGFEPTIYYEARRYSPTRHLSAEEYLYEKQIDLRLRVQWAAELLRDASKRPPAGLVVVGPRYLMLVPNAKDVWPQIVAFRGRRYRKLRNVGPYRAYRIDPGPVPSGTVTVESAYPVMRQAIALGLAKDR